MGRTVAAGCGHRIRGSPAVAQGRATARSRVRVAVPGLDRWRILMRFFAFAWLRRAHSGSAVSMSSSPDAHSAVRDLVAALDRYDTDAVLAAMAPDVMFILTHEAAPLRSREELRAVIDAWLADGPAVEACHAWDLEIRELGPDVAMATQVLSFHLAGVPAPVRQRETLVLGCGADGRWRVVHGHRSPGPYEWAGDGRMGVWAASVSASGRI